VFMARVVGFFVVKVLLRNNSERGMGIGYMVTVFVCEIVFGLLASIIVAWFSRQREFRADAGSAKLLGSAVPMQRALARLGGLAPGALPQSMAASGIFGGASGWGALFSTHPPMEQRIAALQNLPR
ncbi:MAG: M48 family metalloprotease, partial [Bdellovibrionales bacterium]|nr:M48 family metalloprotease [Massilia sp.]